MHLCQLFCLCLYECGIKNCLFRYVFISIIKAKKAFLINSKVTQRWWHHLFASKPWGWSAISEKTWFTCTYRHELLSICYSARTEYHTVNTSRCAQLFIYDLCLNISGINPCCKAVHCCYRLVIGFRSPSRTHQFQHSLSTVMTLTMTAGDRAHSSHILISSISFNQTSRSR